MWLKVKDKFEASATDEERLSHRPDDVTLFGSPPFKVDLEASVSSAVGSMRQRCKRKWKENYKKNVS
ncbi:hypothetical protein HAX54_050916 [Datura stramonium]|uniref:Uncharacterized protein n=1 Tax=Datura stramonium TaxID=4076 RepID=A0ABS8SXS0_DATST|nr:hypothetical protein [Datura stramonium]